MPLPTVGDFVWIKATLPNTKRGRCNVCAEKWPLSAPSGGTEGRTVIARHPLTADEWSLTIAILEQRYPAPRLPEGVT